MPLIWFAVTLIALFAVLPALVLQSTLFLYDEYRRKNQREYVRLVRDALTLIVVLCIMFIVPSAAVAYAIGLVGWLVMSEVAAVVFGATTLLSVMHPRVKPTAWAFCFASLLFGVTGVAIDRLSQIFF